MFRLGLFSCISFLLFAASTCERPADLQFDLPSPKLVVYSNFNNENALQVEVSLSKSITDNSLNVNYVTDAVVEIYKDGDIFIETLQFVPGTPKAAPLYITRELIPEENVLYTIKVDAPGYDPAMAQSMIPRRVPINSLNVTDLQVEELSTPNYVSYSFNVNLSFLDPEEEENFYHLNFHQQFKNYNNAEGDTIVTSYEFQPITFSHEADDNYLISYSEGGGVLFEDTPFNGDSTMQTFRLVIIVDGSSQLLGKMFAELRSVSKEYYLYYNSISRQQNTSDQPFVDDVITYDNVENGFGIFAGYNTTQDSISVFQ